MLASTDTWTIASTVATAIATVVLTGFAGVQLYRERQREQTVRRTADAHVSARAYLLVRRLRSWLRDSDIEPWLRQAQNEDRLDLELRTAREEMATIVSDSGNASPSVAHATRRALVLLIEATDHIESFAAMGHATIENAWDHAQLRRNTVSEIRGCIQLLSDDVVDAGLLNEESILRRERERLDPFSLLDSDDTGDAERRSESGN